MAKDSHQMARAMLSPIRTIVKAAAETVDDGA
jgi:hypothetical protein